MDSDIAISVKHVSKRFKLPHEKVTSIKSLFMNWFRRSKTVENQQALEDISFDIKKGEFFGIVGRNGSGKSTLLKILSDIYQPTSGSVHSQGKIVPFIELGVGFNPELTGRENVYLNGALLGFDRKTIDKQYNDIVAFAELERFMDQKLKNYSSGMQVRLAFSVATRAEADILIVDEVLAVGDADFQRKCYEHFKKLKHDKKTVVFVSHDMAAVQQYCDRVALIEKSKLEIVDKAPKVSVMYSKLFLNENVANQVVDATENPSGEPRWGDQRASWESVKVTAGDRMENDEVKTYTITAKGIANQDIESPIIGFSVKNADFTQLIGTNTMRRNEQVASLKAGEHFTVTWQVPNVFNKGMHYVDCTIAHDQATQVSDRWPDATKFKVFRIEENQYPVYSDGVNFSLELSEER